MIIVITVDSSTITAMTALIDSIDHFITCTQKTLEVKARISMGIAFTIYIAPLKENLLGGASIRVPRGSYLRPLATMLLPAVVIRNRCCLKLII